MSFRSHLLIRYELGKERRFRSRLSVGKEIESVFLSHVSKLLVDSTSLVKLTFFSEISLLLLRHHYYQPIDL